MTAVDFTDHPLADLCSLTGRVAVVTGAAKGIGLAIASRLAEAGAAVVLSDVDVHGLDVATKQLRGDGRVVHARACDAADPAALEALAAHVIDTFDRLDVWVNNAGIYPGDAALDMTPDAWDRVLDLNLRGAFFASRAAARRMGDSGGVIVNVASTAGFEGYAGIAHYVASKHGLVGLTRALAIEWAPLGIRVLGIAPTLIHTPGIEEQRESLVAAGLGDPEQTVVPTIPLGRAGEPDDVARVVLFCASDLSGFMTGSTLLVDGGALA